MSLIIKARDFAREAHKDQKRKWTGEAYFVHPQRVALSVQQRCDSTEEMIAAAYLHDVVEDCGVLLRDIHFYFGTIVTKYVDGLTSYSKQILSKANRAERKRIDLDYLSKQKKEVHIIKLYDRLDNVSDMHSCPDKGFLELYETETENLLEVVGYADPDLCQCIKNIFRYIKELK